MMSARSRRAAALAALLAVAATGAPARAQGKPAGERDRPHDLILAVDVSLSMLGSFEETVNGVRQTFAANDREGIRWDGIQFTVDVARDDDRVALVLYRAESEVVTRFIDPSGFVRLAQPYPRFGNRKGRELLAALVGRLQRLEEGWAREIKAMEARGDRIRAHQFRDYALFLAEGTPIIRFSLEHGTASLLTLRRIERELLPELRPAPARAWTFLFTDGVDNTGPVEE